MAIINPTGHGRYIGRRPNGVPSSHGARVEETERGVRLIMDTGHSYIMAEASPEDALLYAQEITAAAMNVINRLGGPRGIREEPG